MYCWCLVHDRPNPVATWQIEEHWTPRCRQHAHEMDGWPFPFPLFLVGY